MTTIKFPRTDGEARLDLQRLERLHKRCHTLQREQRLGKLTPAEALELPSILSDIDAYELAIELQNQAENPIWKRIEKLAEDAERAYLESHPASALDLTELREAWEAWDTSKPDALESFNRLTAAVERLVGKLIGGKK